MRAGTAPLTPPKFQNARGGALSVVMETQPPFTPNPLSLSQRTAIPCSRNYSTGKCRFGARARAHPAPMAAGRFGPIFRGFATRVYGFLALPDRDVSEGAGRSRRVRAARALTRARARYHDEAPRPPGPAEGLRAHSAQAIKQRAHLPAEGSSRRRSMALLPVRAPPAHPRPPMALSRARGFRS